MHLISALVALGALLLPLAAAGEGVSFQLTVDGSSLTVVNRGSTSAYYPQVFRLQENGRWGRLGASDTVAELAPGRTLLRPWPALRPIDQQSPLEQMQPVMVRFFDKAGVGFGQISLFSPPPDARVRSRTRYDGAMLQIGAPEGQPSVDATWVLWPREEGIAPLRSTVRFEHDPPPALRIDWRERGRAPFRLETGAGQPEVLLLHESSQGYRLQLAPGGNLQGREQRAGWLDATPAFYAGSLLTLLCAGFALVLQFLRQPRAGQATGRAHQ